MDPFLIFLIIIITLVTVLIMVIGIQTILILKKANHTLEKINSTLDSLHQIAHNVTHPLSDLKSLGDGVKTGLHVAEYIVNWVKEKKQSES